jgi:tRNA G37 N-methylase Trm5
MTFHSDEPSVSRRKLLALCGAGLAGNLLALPAWSQDHKEPVQRQPDVPFEPTPQPVVDRMLELAQVNQNDLLYDLGSGDGRIVITAAKKHGTRGIGIDIDPQRITEAQANARAAGVEQHVQFINDDLFQTDFSNATVITLFLWPHINRKLRPQLWQQLKVGTRVVSYIWDMGPEWRPKKTETINKKPIHYWTVTETQKKQVEQALYSLGSK